MNVNKSSVSRAAQRPVTPNSGPPQGPLRAVHDPDPNEAHASIRRDYHDLNREVFGILGIPVDAVDVAEVIRAIKAAAVSSTTLLLSTPNLNFLVAGLTDPEFRESLLQSDLCPVDGIPIVWIARLLGAPIKERVAGSDILEKLKQSNFGGPPSRAFLFGAPPGVAEAAAKVINSCPSNLTCVGHFYPGYGTIEQMSEQTVIDTINASQADLFVASLGAKKGQQWLMKNHHRLKIPVRSHLGAAINFQAGMLKRAPQWIRKFGFEWLWRIKQEPHLWRRYWADGQTLIKLMLTSVLPLALSIHWGRLRGGTTEKAFAIRSIDHPESTELKITGAAIANTVATVLPNFRNAVTKFKSVKIDLSETSTIDVRFFGLILMVRKILIQQGMRLEFTGLTLRTRRTFRLHQFEYLLTPLERRSASV